MSQKFICLAALLLLLGVFSASPVLADWSTNFSSPCDVTTITTNPSGSASVGYAVSITVQSTPITNQITKVLIDGTNSLSLTYANYTQNTATATWSTSGATTGSHTITAKVFDTKSGNLGSCPASPATYTYTLATAPTPTPTPMPGTDTSYGAVSTIPKYCSMKWWEGYCPIWLSWGVPVPPKTTEWTITANDNFTGNQWTACDYTWVWDSWSNKYIKKETCSNYSYTQQWIGLGGTPYGGTVYSLKGKKWGSGPAQLLYQDYAYGYRDLMPPPNISPWASCTNSSVKNPNSIAWVWWYDPYYPITWVDISEDPNFTSYYHKQVSTPGQVGRNSLNYVSAPDGFNGYTGVSGPLVIEPNKVYYARLYPSPWNSGWGWGWFSPQGVLSIPSCPTPTPTSTPTPTPTPTPRPTATPTPTPTPTPPSAPPQNSLSASCPTPGSSATLSWREMNGADSYRLRVGTTVTAPLTSPYYYPSTPGTTYSSWGVKSCKGNLCSSETAGPAFTCAPPSPNQTSLSATCPSPGTTANVYWSGVSGATYYLARVGSTTTDTRVSNPSDPTSVPAPVSTTTNSIYNSWGVKACNTGGCSSEAAGSSQIKCDPYPAFLKTTGGDVHSNQ